MFSYYGSKSKLVNYYPKPTKDLIIEPFAGSARYALKYYDRDVLLVDKYDIIVNIWKYVQSASKNDILKMHLLVPKEKQSLDEFDFDCIEQKQLLGFMIKAGSSRPALTPSKMRLKDDYINTQIKQVAEITSKIKHWKIICGSYDEIENHDATWFIDPPYQFGGEHYPMSNKDIDYKHLAEWCKNRNGQIIVCENTKADWMEFKPLKKIQGASNTNTTEAIFLKGWEEKRKEKDLQAQTLFNELD